MYDIIFKTRTLAKNFIPKKSQENRQKKNKFPYPTNPTHRCIHHATMLFNIDSIQASYYFVLAILLIAFDKSFTKTSLFKASSDSSSISIILSRTTGK